MAGTSGCSHELKELKLSDESEYATPLGSEAVDSVITRPSFLSAVEVQIENSKSHWSELADQSGCLDEGDECSAEVSNVQEFLALQRNSEWGGFFTTFGYDTEIWKRDGEMEVGKKFAEGGQAELFHARVTWWYREGNEEDQKGHEYVLKVFKKGTFLKHLKSHLPHGLLQFHVWMMENFQYLNLYPRFSSNVLRGTLLKDGRFAFLMVKKHFDLRTLIEHNMKSRNDAFYGPFSKEDAEHIMYIVALGMKWLHDWDIVHRDLKASNVLVSESKSGYPKWAIHVADYECSVGVVGTGFSGLPRYYKHARSKS